MKPQARAIPPIRVENPQRRDSLADETVRGEPVSPVCQPVDTLAAVDKAVVDSWALKQRLR
jgi:hypothetical protein